MLGGCFLNYFCQENMMLRLLYFEQLRIIPDLCLYQCRMRSASITVLQCGSVAFRFWDSATCLCYCYRSSCLFSGLVAEAGTMRAAKLPCNQNTSCYTIFSLDHATFTVYNLPLVWRLFIIHLWIQKKGFFYLEWAILMIFFSSICRYSFIYIYFLVNRL